MSQEKKKKGLSFLPLIHTQTTQKLVIFEKLACKTRLIYDEEKKKEATTTSQTAGVTKTSVTDKRGTSG